MDVMLDEDFVVPMVAGSELTYGFDWQPMLEPGQTIVSSAWEIDNAAFIKLDETAFGTYTLIKVGGGVANRSAFAKNVITTNLNGETGKLVKRIHLKCIPG